MSFVTYSLDLPDACRFHEHLLRTGHKMLRAAKHGTLAISAPQWLFFVPVLILCYLVRHQLIRHPSAPPDARETCLAALSSVVIPSRDARKLSSIPHTVDLRSRTITLCSSRIIKGILDDSIELRNPIATLTTLMQDRYETKGWNIRLNVEGSSMKIVFWLLKNQFIFEAHPKATDLPHISQDRNTLFLDTVLHRRWKSAISNTLSLDCIEFTSFVSQNVPSLSPEFILCALPLAYRSRLSSPLLGSLFEVMNIIQPLTHIKIKTVENISKDYSSFLATMERNLVEQGTIRARLVDEHGLEKWRQERFLLAWEAALVDAGFMVRWRIVLDPK